MTFKNLAPLLLVAPLAILTPALLRAESPLHGFVTARGDQLLEDGKPFRFVSFNVPNLHLIEDNMPFSEANPWRLPDRFEISDALESVRQQGGLVVRTYTISVARTNDLPGTPSYVLGPGKFDETAFRALDEVLQLANATGIRLIIPLVNEWKWMGGRAEYAGFRGKSKDEFWTDPQLIADFEQTIHFILTRTNTLTGVPYRDDPAILCWETGNELLSPASWIRQIAFYIKSLDTNHLVMDGYYSGVLRDETMAIPEVDIVTTHHYPNTGTKPFAELVRANWEKAKGKKPYVVGEFGFVSTAQMEAMLDAVIQSGASGALAWSLRFHDRDGGFYWHTEGGSGHNSFKAFHWPGFPSGGAYDEQNFLELMRRKAFEIRGLPMPALPAPAPPRLLPIADAAAISWQGSAGATSYAVERAASKNGPWSVAGENVDDTLVQYRPLFVDTTVSQGRWFYRVIAKNVSGASAPSNVVGPVKVEHATLLDEMTDLSLTYGHKGELAAQTNNCRRAKEDASRVAGRAGDALVYRVAGPIQSCNLYTVFPNEIADFRFFVSADGDKFTEIAGARQTYFQGAGDYGFWKPVRYTCKTTDSTARFLKIEFQGEAQVSRTEIQYQ